MTTPEQQAIEHYASSHYGHLILVDEPLYYEEEGLFVSNLRSDYPLIIKDDKPPQKKALHLLQIDNLGFITLDKNGKIVKERTTSRDECVRNIDSFFDMWKRRAEEIVVAASSDNLVKISRYNHFFDPIHEILSSLWDYRYIHNKEIDFERGASKRKRMRLYLGLLEGLQVVCQTEDGYSEGNLAITLRDKYRSDENGFRDAVISTILRERYPTLRDVFKLTILEPTIHIDNCIYLPEIEIEEQVHRSIESIEHDYRNYYQRRINSMVLKRVLKQLVSAEAIEQEGKHYFGNKTLLKEMVNMKKRSVSISKEFLVKA